MKQLSATQDACLNFPTGPVHSSFLHTNKSKERWKVNDVPFLKNVVSWSLYLHRYLLVNKLHGNKPDTYTDTQRHKHNLPIVSSHLSLHGVLPVTEILMAATRGLLLSSFRLSRISPLV